MRGQFAISDIVKHSPTVGDFRCSSTWIGSDGGVALSEALEGCFNMRKLDLRDNMFLLTKLNLAENELKDEGAIQIAKGWGEILGTGCGSETWIQAAEHQRDFISEDGVDDVKETFKKCPEMLASLEENDPEGGDDEESKEEEGDDQDDHDLESKLKNLEVGEDD
ncbi:hypothetical protein MLD38_016895 [Melastoma candidum]|uniref:Uncharacterized protein n=1 Tax=Melastoma candidum TaxID=119954 RepID=A0ACB9QN79_9MYRT|nr:hypothetical protein MLD38_016895 [Melastoma candidum]